MSAIATKSSCRDRLIAETLDAIENNAVYINALPKMRTTAWNRGLYGAVRGGKGAAAANMAMLWILNLSDGTHSVLDIAERAGLPFAVIVGPYGCSSSTAYCEMRSRKRRATTHRATIDQG